MSIFGTLGKKTRRKNSVSNQGLGLGDQSEDRREVFKSTPNLHSVDGRSSPAVDSAPPTVSRFPFDSPSGLVYYDYEKNPRTPFRIFPSQDDRGGVSPERASNSSLSSMSHSVGSEDRHVVTPASVGKTPFSFRGFVSMVSTGSALKKTKSVRRKAFASATHLRTTDHSLRDAEGIIHEDSVDCSSSATTPRRSYSANRSLSIKSSHSVPNMEDGGSGHRLRSSSIDDVIRIGQRRFNGEPGVESSSTSLSSAGTNPSVSENDSFASSRSRCPSVTSRSVTDPDPDSISQNDPEIERRKLMLQGAKKFNMDPKKGIDFLVLNGLLDRTPESIAQFLKHGEQLSKSAIGNYLGEHHEFNLEVLNAFVELHDFTNVLLVEALRQFLWSFRLPGEAQKIDRMMECFAKRYTFLNPTLFANSDTCYLLSFAIIMLNTSLHNPNVKEKPSLEQFVLMNRDIDAGQALERKFITSLYNSILTEPFQIPPEDGNDLMLTFFNPAIEGWLWKQGGRYKGWKRRWFILSNNCLYYFLFTTDKDPRGIIPLENIRVRKTLDLGKEFCFTLYKESSDPRVTDYIKSCKASDGKLTAGKHVRYHLATKSKEDCDRWMAAIAQNSSYHNFYTVLAQKKNRFEAAQRSGATVKRTRTMLTPKGGVSPVGTSPGAIRKSRIGLPLTSTDLAKSFNHLPSVDLLSPDRTLGRDPHEYFASSTVSTSNLAYDGSGEYFGQSESEEGSPNRGTVEASPHGYCTQSLPRTKPKKKLHRLPVQPVRKFSLPPDTLPGRLISKIEYLTSPGIRISVEDTEGERRVDAENESLPASSDERLVLSPDFESVQYHVKGDLVPETESDRCDPDTVPPASDAAENPNKLSTEPEARTVESETKVNLTESQEDCDEPVSELPPVLPPRSVTSTVSTDASGRCTSSLILALKDFANVMENLNIGDMDSPDNEWVELDSLSVEELHDSGLTKQCLRSSFKSKRSRYRNKHRKYPSSEHSTRKSTVISLEDLVEMPQSPPPTTAENRAQYPPFEITVIEGGLKRSETKSDREFHSEV